MSYKSERFKNNNEYVWLECKDSKDIEYFLDAFNRALEKISDIDYELLEDEALQYGLDNIDRYFDKFSLYILLRQSWNNDPKKAANVSTKGSNFKILAI